MGVSQTEETGAWILFGWQGETADLSMSMSNCFCVSAMLKLVLSKLRVSVRKLHEKDHKRFIQCDFGLFWKNHQVVKFLSIFWRLGVSFISCSATHRETTTENWTDRFLGRTWGTWQQWRRSAFFSPFVSLCNVLHFARGLACVMRVFGHVCCCAKSLQGEAPCGSAVYGKVDEMSPAPLPPNPLHPPNPLPPNPPPWDTHSQTPLPCGRPGGQGRIGDITGKGLRTVVALSTASCFLFRTCVCTRPCVGVCIHVMCGRVYSHCQ